jgi:hypothetical protein
LVSILSSHSDTGFTLQPKTRIKLTFLSFSVRKLNSIHNKCISEEELNNFGEDYFDFIFTDCYFKSLNQSYGCIFLYDLSVNFDTEILKNGYKFCKNLNVTIDSITQIAAECSHRLKPECNSTNFNPKIETTKLLSNETILEFIPQKSPRIAYIETYKTDFNRLIYNCGGVLSLWFGLTPTKLVDILKYLPLISKILISKSIKIVHYLKAIGISFALNLISISKRFGLYLFAIGDRFAQNSFGICKLFGIYLFGIGDRFAQNSFGICKRFGIYLFGIGVRFAQNLISISKRFVLYFFGIGVRFSQNLIGICKRFSLFFIANIITFAYNLIAIFKRFVRHLF